MGARALAGGTLAAAALLLPGIAAGEEQFTAEEVRAIVAHGPWPPPLATSIVLSLLLTLLFALFRR